MELVIRWNWILQHQWPVFLTHMGMLLHEVAHGEKFAIIRHIKFHFLVGPSRASYTDPIGSGCS